MNYKEILDIAKSISTKSSIFGPSSFNFDGQIKPFDHSLNNIVHHNSLKLQQIFLRSPNQEISGFPYQLFTFATQQPFLMLPSYNSKPCGNAALVSKANGPNYNLKLFL